MTNIVGINLLVTLYYGSHPLQDLLGLCKLFTFFG
jgi:hypothetical protein